MQNSVLDRFKVFRISVLKPEVRSSNEGKEALGLGVECTARGQVRSGRVGVNCTLAPTGWAARCSHTPGLCARTRCPAAPDTPSVYRWPDQLGINGGRTYSVVRGITV